MKHLLSIDDLDRRRHRGAARPHRARSSRCTQRDIPKVPALRGKTVVSLFYEDSTRTRLSFETAAKRLSADTMTFSVVDVVGEEGREPARHGADDRGDGHRRDRRAPPCRRRAAPRRGMDRRERRQRAATAATSTRRRRCSTRSRCARHRGPSLDGCRIAIVGDIRHSRVARSNVKAFARARLRGHAGRAADAAARARSTAGRSR